MRNIIKAAILSLILFSCNKIKTPEKSKLKVEDGILVFDDFTTFSSTLKAVNNLADKEKDEWERTLGFISFRTKYDELNKKLESETNSEAFYKIITKASTIVKMENEEIKPLVNNYFSSIVNPEGIVRIKGDYYRFYKDYETIVLNGSVDRVKKASETKYENRNEGIFSRKTNGNAGSVTTNRYTCTPGVLSECTSSNGSNRRGYHKVEFNYYFGIVYDIYSMPSYWEEELQISLHFSAQKKILVAWVEYSTSYLCYYLNYSDLDGVNLSLTNLSSGGDFKHWYYSLNFKSYQTPYGNQIIYHLCSPDITLFNCKANTGGTNPNYCIFTY